MARPVLATALFGGVVVASCRPVDPDRQTVGLTNDGAICLGEEADAGDAGKSVDLPVNQPLAITVRSPCLSVHCVKDRVAKCSVKRDGDRLVVTSEMSWSAPTDLGVGKECGLECAYIDAKCQTESLPEGTYKVVLGGKTLDVALPSRLAYRCDRDRPPTSPIYVDAAPPPPPPVATNAQNVDPAMVPAAPGTGVAASGEPPPGDTLCIGPADANKARLLKKGGAVAFTFLHKNECLGNSCTKAPGKCTVKRKGFDINITTQFPSSTTKPTMPCSDDCSAIAATCKTDALKPGTYNIMIGQQKKVVSIPSTAPGCL